MKNNEIIGKIGVFLIILLITLAIFIVKYRGFGEGNTNEWGVLALNEKNPETLKNDWFVNSVEDFNVRGNFLKVFGLFNLIFNDFEITSIVLLFLLMLIFGFGFYSVMFLITKNQFLSLFSVIFCFGISKPSIGGHPFEIGDILISSTMAFAIIIWSLFLFLKKDYFLSFLLLGLASMAHISNGVLVYGLFVFVILFRKENFKEKVPILIKSLSFFIFFAFAIIPLLDNYSEINSNLSNEESIYLFKFRAPWHYTIFYNWGFLQWGIFLLMLSLFFYGLCKSKIDKNYKEIFLLFGVGSFAFYFLEVFFSMVVPLEASLKLDFFRISGFFEIIISIILIEFGYNFVKDRWEKIDVKSKGNFRLLSILVGVLIVSNFVFVYLVNERFATWVLLRGFYIFVMVLFTLIFVVESNYARGILLGLLVILLIGLIVYAPLTERVESEDVEGELFEFVKKNTAKNSIFLVPPDGLNFRLMTHRAIVVDVKSFPYSESAMSEWYERILDVTGSDNLKFERGVEFKRDLEEKYESLTEENVLMLREKYGVEYGVFKAGKDFDFEKVFQNEVYEVYFFGS